MVKRIGRRFVSLLLTFVTILTMLPAMTLSAMAAENGTVTGLADQNIGLSFNGNEEDAWTASGTTINGKTTPASGSGCSAVSATNSTLTIQNNKTVAATLSFKYRIVISGTVKIGGKAVTSDGEYSAELGAGKSIKVYLEGAKLTITNIALFSDVTATTTFQAAINGSYTVDGEVITEEFSKTQGSLTAYQLVATPDSGYQFLGWYSITLGKYISTDAATSLNIESDCTITAKFAADKAALFETGGQPFDNLNEAVTYAQNNSQSKITLTTDGTIDGIYNIPAGITLLIPFDAAGTLYTTTPASTTTAETQKAYKTLTMAAGSSITVNGGAISVGGKHFTSSNRECCKPTGAYGLIKMQEGSSIMLNNGANLYAWGYITGDGQITANSGANVYEYFQVTDWRGGTQTSNMERNEQKVFPFTQYYVQNIEAALTLNAGANEYTYISVTARIVGTKSVKIPFVGSNGLFKLGANGQFTKRYIPAQDRMVFTISGEASLNSIAMSIAKIATFDSKDYVLPINNNVDIVITSGTTTIEKDAALLPGVTVLIAKDAELKVASGASLYVYDDAEWSPNYVCGKNSFGIHPVSYSPSGKGSRGIADAKVDVNGVLTVAGAVYTTATGANITSSEKTGKYAQVGAPGTSNKTYQFNQNSTEYIGVDITAAKLKNANDSYTETKDAKAGDTFTYCTCPECNGKWMKNLQVAAINDSTGKQQTTHNTLKEAVGKLEAGQYIKLLHNTTEDIKNITKDIYLDLNGRTVTGDITVTGDFKLYGMDSTAGADYTTAPKGKIVGTVTGCAPTYQTPGDTNDRYVAILSEENGTSTLSFHRFNISVTGYRFELAAPECALFFIGKFQGDKAARNHLTELGFTLKGNNNNQLGEDSYKFTAGADFPPMPAEGEAIDSKVVRSGDDFLFEVYLKRSFDKENRNGYTEEISATARAKFDNGGEQQSDPQALSFQKAWQNAEISDSAQQEILDNFLQKLGITKQTE